MLLLRSVVSTEGQLDSTITIGRTQLNINVPTASDIWSVTVDPDIIWIDIKLQNGNQTLDNETFVYLPGVEKVVMHIDNVASIEHGTFRQLTALKTLHLTQSLHASMCDTAMLTSLQDHIFEGLSSLTVLDLSSLCLTSLGEEVFSGLSSLQELTLASNQLSMFERETFFPVIELTVINLNRNFITNEALRLHLFQHNEKLVTINLGYNLIGQLDAGMLTEKHSQLDHLAMDHNQIATIQPWTFKLLSRLRSLNLQNNRIKEIRPRALAGLLNIHSLDLIDNRITRIDKDIFSQDVPTLSTLLLHNNRIQYIDPDAFQGMNEMKILILYNNELTTLPRLHEQLPGLDALEIRGNYWMCDCELSWIFRVNHFISPRDKEEFECDQPSNMTGRSYSDVQTHRLLDYCYPATTVAPNIGDATTGELVGDEPNNTTSGYLPVNAASKTSKWRLHVIIICVIILAVVILAVIVVCFLCQYQRGKYDITEHVHDMTIDVPDRNKLLINPKVCLKHRAWISDPETGTIVYLPPKAVEELSQQREKEKNKDDDRNQSNHNNPMFQNSVEESEHPMEGTGSVIESEHISEKNQRSNKYHEIDNSDPIDYTLESLRKDSNRKRKDLVSTSSHAQLLPTALSIDKQELITENDIPVMNINIQLDLCDIVFNTEHIPKSEKLTVVIDPTREQTTCTNVDGDTESCSSTSSGVYNMAPPVPSISPPNCTELNILPQHEAPSDASFSSTDRTDSLSLREHTYGKSSRRKSNSSAEHTIDSGQGNTDSDSERDSVVYSDTTFSTTADVHTVSDNTSTCSDYSSNKSSPDTRSQDTRTVYPKTDHNQNIEKYNVDVGSR